MQLAERLMISLDELRQLEQADDNYIRWIDKKTDRPIQRPKPHLERVHRRVGDLLSRMDTPDYLHSAVKGRSYITNAEEHDSSQPTVKIDIRKFYPSTRAQAVYHFFRDRMLCDGDVAGLLAKLLTVNGHLATGSSASPILSFFAYEDMFNEIYELAEARGCVMTCYIDDMVFTGSNAGRRLIYDVIQIVRCYRLWGHKTKCFKAEQPKVITGVALTRAGSRLPNKRQKAIADGFAQLAEASTDLERLSIMRTLIGRLYEAAQVDPSWAPRARALAEEKRGLERDLQRKGVSR